MRRPTGKVVGIIKRNSRPLCGMLMPSPIKEATRHLFTPADRRMPRVRVETRQAASLQAHRIVVAIGGWLRHSRYPNVRLHRDAPDAVTPHPSVPCHLTNAGVPDFFAQNIEIQVDSAKALAESLDRAAVPGAPPYLNTLLRILATRCMMQAIYFCSGMEPDTHHYGLATAIYTHFTSPIRRYSDVIVHRLLAVCVGADPTYPALTDKQKQQQLCNNLNYRHKMAQYAQRSSVAFHTQLKAESGKMRRPTGKVVGIIKRNSRPLCGMLMPSPIKEATRHLFTPADRRMPRVRVETRQAASLQAHRIVVAIGGWLRHSRYPNVRLHRDAPDAVTPHPSVPWSIAEMTV
ncbi:exosome complex exonuclease RRP44-like [Petromyzon marinus]|uniref:exosome complex exonuclease RRP44-like n=1 Tax=Petromyzon marinus TaxID=7757 RepID=UPI003F72A0DF